MKNRIGFNRLSRRPAHRKALKRNMVTSFLLEERITTTQTKALEIRRMAEKMVTRAKEDSVHNRRMIARDVKDKKALAKLFTEIGPRFKNRQGGYTRVLKLGPRLGDAAEMVLIEFVERTGAEPQDTRKKKVEAKKTAAKPAGESAKSGAKPSEKAGKASPLKEAPADATAEARAAESAAVAPVSVDTPGAETETVEAASTTEETKSE